MSTLSFALRDSATMLRRDVQHSLRNLPMTLSGLLVPIIMLVLFVYVFGGAIGAGLSGVAHGAYINYIAPGIIVLTVGSGGATTALNLCTDMNEGIIARFRTMAIFRASVLTGQVLGSLMRTMISVGLVIGVALLMGFRPTTNPVAWIAALGVIALFTFALTWMSVVFGLVGKTPAGANSLSLIFQLLSFTSSALARPDSMAGGGYAGSPSTSPSRPSSTRCGGCCWGPRSEIVLYSPLPGAASSPWLDTCGRERYTTAALYGREAERTDEGTTHVICCYITNAPHAELFVRSEDGLY